MAVGIAWGNTYKLPGSVCHKRHMLNDCELILDPDSTPAGEASGYHHQLKLRVAPALGPWLEAEVEPNPGHLPPSLWLVPLLCPRGQCAGRENSRPEEVHEHVDLVDGRVG